MTVRPLLASCPLCLLTVAALFPQTLQPPALRDPQALLAAARTSNGLTGDDLKPWHLKASYELFDDNGKPLGTGVFEEWWAAKDKWKQSYTGGHYTGTRYHSQEGIAQKTTVPWPESLIADALITPIPERPPESVEMESVTTPAEKRLSLRCVVGLLKDPNGQMQESPYSYCFDDGSATLRIRDAFYVVSTYTQTGLFQRRHIGVDTTIQVNHRVLAKMHVEALEVVAETGADLFASTEPLTFTPDSGFAKTEILPPKLLHSRDPVFPPGQDPQTAGGKVVALTTVGTDGRAGESHVLASPGEAFTASALESLHSFRFRPAQWQGKPIAATINVEINFKVSCCSTDLLPHP